MAREDPEVKERSTSGLCGATVVKGARLDRLSDTDTGADRRVFCRFDFPEGDLDVEDRNRRRNRRLRDSSVTCGGQGSLAAISRGHTDANLDSGDEEQRQTRSP